MRWIAALLLTALVAAPVSAGCPEPGFDWAYVPPSGIGHLFPEGPVGLECPDKHGVPLYVALMAENHPGVIKAVAARVPEDEIVAALSRPGALAAAVKRDAGRSLTALAELGWTPSGPEAAALLHDALVLGSVSAAETLVALGAKVDRETLCAAFGRRPDAPPDGAARRFAVTHAAGGVELSCGGTPLIVLAAEERNPDLARFLLSHGANPDAREQNTGRTALVAAMDSMEGDLARLPELVRVLLEAGADPNLADKEGRTALTAAAGLKSPETPIYVHKNLPPVVQLLLTHGADVRLRDAQGRTAADVARDNGVLMLLRPRTLARDESMVLGAALEAAVTGKAVAVPYSRDGWDLSFTAAPTGRTVDVEYADMEGNPVTHPGTQVVRVESRPVGLPVVSGYLVNPEARFLRYAYRPGDRIMHNYGITNPRPADPDTGCPIRVTAVHKTWITQNAARGIHSAVERVEFNPGEFSDLAQNTVDLTPVDLVLAPGATDRGHLLVFETSPGVPYDVIYSSFRYEYETLGDCPPAERDTESMAMSFVVDY